MDCERLRDKPIAEVDTEDLLSVLKPLWLTTLPSAIRTRGQIEAVLSLRKGKGTPDW